MNKTKVWYSIQNGGDGSAYPYWFLTSKDADKDQEIMDECWGESCIGSVETYEGSDIHKAAKRNSKELIKRIEEWEADDNNADPDFGYLEL